MRVTQISTTYERKFNLGDYQSLKLAVTAWASLDEDDDYGDAVKALQADCRCAVREEYLALKEKLQPGQSVEASSQIAQ